jgi:hypothetical protein
MGRDENRVIWLALKIVVSNGRADHDEAYLGASESLAEQSRSARGLIRKLVEH